MLSKGDLIRLLFAFPTGPNSSHDSSAKVPEPSSSTAESEAPSGDASTESEAKSDGKVVKIAPGTLFKKDENGERLYEAEPDCYNGARRDLYSWSQKHREIDIHVKIPEHIKSARQLTVKIERKHIKITENGVEQPILDANLSMDIKTETVQWSFETDEHLVSFFFLDLLRLLLISLFISAVFSL